MSPRDARTGSGVGAPGRAAPSSPRGGDRQAFGRAAEDAAARWAEERGWRVVCRNWRCRFGEIDLVAKDGDTWVAVEVRARRSAVAGTPLESITPRKRLRLYRLASAFAATAGCSDAPWRFDVCAVTSRPDGSLALEWVKDAFAAW